MTHPSPEQWMDYLYGEIPPHHRAELESHLAQCTACATRLAQWQSSKTTLDQWHWPQSHPRSSHPRTLLHWAAAALLMIIAGFALGRWVAPQTALPRNWADTIRTEVQRQVQEDRTPSPTPQIAALAREQRALNHSLHILETQRQQDLQSLYDALLQLEANRLRDFATLRRELETVAVFAESHLRKTEQNLISLAQYTAPDTQPSTTTVEPFNPEP